MAMATRVYAVCRLLPSAQVAAGEAQAVPITGILTGRPPRVSVASVVIVATSAGSPVIPIIATSRWPVVSVNSATINAPTQR